MGIKAIDLLTVAAALTVTTSAHAYNSPPACPDQPSLAQCQNPGFMYGTCGAPFLEDARTNPDIPSSPVMLSRACALHPGSLIGASRLRRG